MSPVILNAGPGAWAFESLALELSQVLQIPIATTPAQRNYVLSFDGDWPVECESFIPLPSVAIATDKRETACVFAQHAVPSPRTFLLDDAELQVFWEEQGNSKRWLLKWPTGCGGAGHRFFTPDDAIPSDWPRPLVVQEFIEMERPEVFRLYCVGEQLFGFNARRFEEGEASSPIVAHARGARYDYDEKVPPPGALEVAEAALRATGLFSSFGAVDLLLDADGKWFALEVNTDGIWMHVDRDLPVNLRADLNLRLGHCFSLWSFSGSERVDM